MTNEKAGQTWETPDWIAEGKQTIRYGILANIFMDWEFLLKEILFIEELGYDAACIFDHPTNSGAADCWTTLAMLAVATKRIRLMSAVSCTSYRHPAVLARMAADVDRVSKGRLILGLGMGDDEIEFKQLGLPFPNIRERQERLEETIQIIQGLWRGEPFHYQGTHFQLEGANGHPLPVQHPHVPLLIGGGGERVTLRQVAQYADMSNFGPHIWTGSTFRLEDVQRKFETLNVHCETFGRPPETILRSYFVPTLLVARTPEEVVAKQSQFPLHKDSVKGAIVGTAEEVKVQIQTLVNMGIQYFIIYAFPTDTETLEIFAKEIMPAIQHPG
ncbi:LLM class flavin-dependent oxidoreductase [Tengunoibacter tsumagoiensis]|uniref:LLM class F420-dependent oxidoreductase n=1 Tax=Tengunoibacter tsumagoiensis TaxID=2014871 RepID=A0A402A9N2_9CHLR|nr:LLM class flavin-dependent oxidoreductase [Tengunoibacter tsumagoiensis]GCE15850.1 LLM class F420-dependent oxidoreductase [Tengunoibacter tsumagoiensis]